MQPREALYGLAFQLRQRGMERIYAASDARLGVLSVAAADVDPKAGDGSGMTIWTDGRVLCWQEGDSRTRLPAADPLGAARVVTRTLRHLGGEKESTHEAQP